MEQIIYTGMGVFGCISFICGVIALLHKSKHIKFDVFKFTKNLLYKDLSENMAKMQENITTIQSENKEREKESIRFRILLYRKMQLNGLKLTDYDLINENAMYDSYKAMGGNSYITKIHNDIEESNKILK